MKTRYLLPILVIAAVGCKKSNESYESANPAPAASAAPEAGYGTGTTGSMTTDTTAPRIPADVISVNLPDGTITLVAPAVPPATGVARTANKEKAKRTLSVDMSARDSLSNVKAGDEIMISCLEPATAGAPSKPAASTLAECHLVTMIEPSPAGTGTTGAGTTGR